MPGTQIIVDLTIDTTICPYDIDDIMDAMTIFKLQDITEGIKFFITQRKPGY